MEDQENRKAECKRRDGRKRLQLKGKALGLVKGIAVLTLTGMAVGMMTGCSADSLNEARRAVNEWAGEDERGNGQEGETLTVESAEAERVGKASTSAQYPSIQNPITKDDGTIQFTVTKAYVLDKIGSTKPLDGAAYMVVEYKYKNISHEPTDIDPSVCLMDSGFVKYKSDVGATSAALFAFGESTEKIVSNLNPGLTVKGLSVFEIAKEDLLSGDWNVYYVNQSFLGSLFGEEPLTLYYPFDGMPDFSEGYGNAKADGFYEEEQQIGGTAGGGMAGESGDAGDTLEDDYVFPESSVQSLAGRNLETLSQDELRIGKNEIYARHGRRFKDASLQAYFDSKPWYNGTIQPENFDERVLSQVEKDNIQILQSYLK